LVLALLARNKTLDQDLELFSTEPGLRYTKRKRQRIGAKRDYRSYYQNSLVELINQTWGRELKLFGYHSDSIDLSSALVQRDVDHATKRRVKCFWSEDGLLVGGDMVP
jgi:hypothetical protein